MAKQVTWDDAASDDLLEVYSFLLDKSERYADALMEAIFDRIILI